MVKLSEEKTLVNFHGKKSYTKCTLETWNLPMTQYI